MTSKMFRKIIPTSLIVAILASTIGPIASFAALISSSSGAPYVMGAQTISANSAQTPALGLNLGNATSRTVTAMTVTVAGPNGSFNPATDLDGMNPVSIYNDTSGDGAFDFATDTQIASNITSLNPNGVRLSNLTPLSTGTYTINGVTNTTTPGLHPGEIVYGNFNSADSLIPTWGVVTTDLTGTTFAVNGRPLDETPHVISKFGGGFTGALAVTTGAAGANPWSVIGGGYTPANGDLILYQTGSAPAIWGVVTDASSTNQNTFKVNGSTLSPSTTYTIGKLDDSFTRSTTAIDPGFSDTLVSGMNFNVGDLVFSNSGFGGYQWSVVTTGDTIAPGGMTGITLRFNDSYSAPRFAAGTRVTKITPSGTGRSIDATPTFTAGDATFTYTIADNYLAAYGWRQVSVGGLGGMAGALSFGSGTPVYPAIYRIVPNTPIDLPTSAGGHGASGYNLFVTIKTGIAAANGHQFLVALAGSRSIEISSGDTISTSSLYAGNTTQQALKTGIFTIGALGDGNDVYTSASVIISGDANSAAIDPAGDVDFYRFTPVSSQSYRFAVTNTTIAGHYINLYDSTGMGVIQAGTLDSDMTFSGTMGTTYYLKVANSNPAGTGSYTYSLSSLGGGGPGPGANVPTGLISMSHTSSSIDLSWNSVAPGAEYQVARSTSFGGPYAPVGSTTFTTSFTDTGLSSMTTYYYEVRSIISATYSDYSSPYNVTTSAGGAPAGDGNDSEVTATLAFTAMPITGNIGDFSDVDYYKFSVTSGSTYTIATTLTTLGSGTVQAYGDGAYSSGAPTSMPTSIVAHANVDGYFYVVVRGSASMGDYGLNITLGGGGGPGGNTPTGLGSMANTSTAINLSWTAVVGATDYEITRSTSEFGMYTTLTTTMTNSYQDSNLNPMTTYWYKVRALVSAIYSDYSSAYSATTSAGGGGGDNNDTSMTATPITVNSITPTNAAIDTMGDVDYYSFTGMGGTSYTIHTTGTISPGTVHASGSGAYDSGTPVSIPGDITFTANGMGTYYIDVRGAASTGNYIVWVTSGGGGGGDNNDTEGSASTITVGAPATSAELTPGDLDYYTFSGTSGTTYTIHPILGTLASGTMSVTGAGGYSSGPISMSGDITFTAGGTGPFIIRVGSGGPTGTYTLAVSSSGGGGGDLDGNTTFTATAIDVGSTKNARIDYDGDLDFFSFTGTSGTSYTVSPNLFVLTGGSYQVTGAGDYGSASVAMTTPLTFTAPATGTFYVGVAGTGPLIGTYSIIVTSSGGGGGGAAPTLTFSGPANNTTNVPISALISFAFSTALDFSTLIPSNITFTKNVGGIPTNVDYTVIPSYSGFQIAISSKPTFASSSYFSKFSSGPTSVSLNGTLQGGYTPTAGDIVFVQKGNFAPYFGIYTGSGAVNGFNLMNGDRITKIATPGVTGQVHATNQTLTVNTGDLVLAYTADNHDQANGFTWHMVTDGGDMGEHVVSPELNNPVILDNYTGNAAQNYLSPYFSTISPAATVTDNGTTAGNTLDVNQGDLIFAKLASESVYKWHLVTQTGVLSSAGSESTAGVDGLNSNDSRVVIGSVMSSFGALGLAGPILADTNSFAVGDVIFAKTTAGAANNNSYNFHMVTKPASSSINNDTLRFDNATSDLESNTAYNISISTNVKGSGGTNLASPITLSFVTSSNSTTNTAPPVIQATTPNVGNMNFPINSKIKVDFSVPMAISGGGSVLNTSNVGIFENNFGQPGAAIGAINTYDSSKNEVVVTPNSALQTNHDYILQINSSTASLTGTVIPGTRIIGFRTSVNSTSTTPTITSTFPARDGTNVTTQLGAVAINFSEDMDQSTLSTYDGDNDGSTASVTLKQGDTYVAGSLNYNSFEHTLYLSPESVLAPNSPYTITVKTSVQSINGAAIATQFTSSFTTGSADIVSTNPYITNSICDQFSCAVTFSEPMKHSGNQESVDNSANWNLESPNQSPISVANKTITYDGSTMTAKMTGLALTTGDQYKIVIGSSVKSTAEQTIQSDNRTVYGTVISANITGGQVGLAATATNIDPSINGMTPINVFVQKLSAGADSNYILDFPAKSSIPSTGQIVITFPVGFNLTNARDSDGPGENVDINGNGSGTITMSSVVADTKARTITITTAGGNIATNDHVKISLKSIGNSSIVSQAGYSLQIQLKDTADNNRLIKENLTSNKFFLNAAGTHSLTVRVINDTNRNNVRDDGEASVNGTEVYIWSPASGAQEGTVTDGQAVFENLPTDNYNVSIDPSTITNAGLNLNKNWNNIFLSSNGELTFAATGAANTISGTVTGTPGTSIDIFASGMSGDFSFKKTTGTIGGGGTYTYTLPASANSTYNVNVGPAMAANSTMAGGIAAIPTFTFMPPAPKQVHVVSSNVSNVDFTLSSLDKTISGTVTDNNGNTIPGATIFARPTSKLSGETAMGLSTQSDSSGNYSLNVKVGDYLVSAYKPGMPFIEDQRISVPSVGANSPASLNFKFSARTGTTITGRVLDKNGNAVPYAGVWGYKVNSTMDTTATGGSGGNNTSSQTDANGNYTLYVSTGTWNIATFAPGLGKMPAKTIQVGSESVTGQDFNASTMDIGTVSGTAAQGASGQAGVAVMISNSNFSNNTVTANDGTFSMNVPEGSNYTMTCFFPGNGNSSPITNITVTKDQTLTQNCTINNAMAIQVRLTDGTNPITDAFVDVRDASGNGNGTNVNQTSGIYGVYTINVPAGRTYNLTANSTTFGEIGRQSNIDSTGTFTFTAPSALHTIAGTVLAGETGIPNAWVSLFGTVEGSNNNIHIGAQTDADGEFSISIPNGNYKLRVDKTGYIASTMLTMSVHNENFPGTTIGMLPAIYSVNGSVTLDGEAVANAKVDAVNDSGGFVVTESDTDGNYSLPINNGTWTVRAHSIGYESAASTITIAGGNSNANVLTLSAISGFTIRPEVVNTFAPSVGGFIENQNIGDKFRMTVPANALGSSANPASIHTQIDTTLPRSPTGTIFKTNAVSITAVDASGELIKSLDGQVTIVIPYDPTLLPDGTDENALVIAYWNPSTQSYETLATTVDTVNHTLTAVTNHFSSFAPMLPSGSSAPATPTGLASSSITATSVNLTWDAAVSATTYNIYRSTDGGDTFPLLKSVSAPAVTTSDSGLTAATLYKYKVSAESADGESASSSSIDVTTASEVTIPATPTGFASSNLTTSTADLSWTSSGGATGYKIYKNDVLSATVAAPATSTTATGLSAGSYTFKITAYNDAGESSQSSGITVTISSNQDNGGGNSGGSSSGGGSLPSTSKTKNETRDDKATAETPVTTTKTEEKNTLSDVEDSWAKTEIKAMISKGIVKGNAEGKFKPEDNLNRADSAMLICRVMKIDETQATENNPFKDVEKEAYFGSCVAQLKAAQITTGNADGTFTPANSINRAEFIALAMRAYGTFLKDQEQKDFNIALNSKYPKYSFTDVSTKKSWYANIAYVAQNKGFVMGRECGKTKCFDGTKTITRAEATTILYRMFIDLLNQ